MSDINERREDADLDAIEAREPVLLNYEACRDYPVGTLVADAYGYWQRCGRRYLKTADSTWAYFAGEPTEEEKNEAIRKRTNNISPCPSGYLAYVTYPSASKPKNVPEAYEIPFLAGTRSSLEDLVNIRASVPPTLEAPSDPA